MLFAVPALLKVLFIFALILVLNRLGLHLGLALAIGGIALALWFQQGIAHSFGLAAEGIFNMECFLLLTLIFEILALATLMERTGVMRQMITSVRSLVPSRRMALAMLPAMIGLLPMPGGAAVSAPMVDAADEDNIIEPVRKTAINYWFRHSWEYWWPLYPGALLAYEISRLTLLRFAIIQMPLTVFSILFGTLFLLLPLKMGAKKRMPARNFKGFIASMFPIILAVVLSLFAGMLTKRIYPSRYLPMVLGLVGAIAWVNFVGKAGKAAWAQVFKSKRNYLLLLVIVGVKVFSASLEAPLPGGGRAVDSVRQNLMSLNVPPVLVVMVIPFISGMITGLALGFVGASFPIVMALLGAGAPTSQVMAYIVLAYGFGYMGMMMSPVHVCFVVTNEYFDTTMLQAYRKLWGPALGVLSGAVLISFLASRFG